MRITHFSAKALLEAIALVMKNDCMRFGDIIAPKLSGIAMGISPAPTIAIANLFATIFEEERILQHLDTWLLYLKWFIDNGFGIWLHDQDPAVNKANWTTSQSIVN
ncbi:hypothetical protein ACHAXR_009793 [Thalassiosira sp. AJA248-18]